MSIKEFFINFVRNYNKQNQQMKKMKQAVLATAKKLAHPNNTFTTLEIKNELLKTHAQYYWKQDLISQIMDEYAQNGQFKYTFNGTFRTYSDPTYVFPAGKTALKVVKTKRGVPVSQAPIKRTRGGQAGVKRGPYKKTRLAAQATINNIKTAAKAYRVAATIAKNSTFGAKPKNPNHNVPALSKTKAVQILLSAKPRYSNKAEFIKQDGTLRKIKYELIPGFDKPDALGYLTVKDCKLEKIDPNNCIRMINCQTVKGLKVNAKRYTVK